MTKTHEAPTKPAFESGLKFASPEQQVGAMAGLIEEAAAWSMQHGPAVRNERTETGGTVEIHDGMRLADFRTFVGRSNPGMAPKDRDTWAARMVNDTIRYDYGMPMPEDPTLLDTTSATATVAPSKVMQYGVDMIRQTGTPIEGTALEAQINHAIDAHIGAVGGDPQSEHAAMQRADILGTQQQ